MTDRRVATIILAAIAIVIAFYNALQGRFVYCVLALPLVVACFLAPREAKTLEFFGVFLASIYVTAFQAMYVGLAGCLLSYVLFSARWPEPRVQKAYIVVTTAFVFCAALLKLHDVINVFIAALLYAALYFVFSFVLHFVLKEMQAVARDAKPLDDKCIDALEEALSTAHEALELAKKGAEDARSKRTDCDA